MTATSTASIPTEKGSRYLQQLCKHFAHKTDVEFTPTSGWIKFDFGRGDLSADGGGMTMVVNAENTEDLARLKKVLASHLERFAFREELTINWST